MRIGVVVRASWLGAVRGGRMVALLAVVAGLTFPSAAAAEDQGYALIRPGSVDKSSYVLRLVANGQNVEALRTIVQAAAVDVSWSGGPSITVAAGTIPNREAAPGEILLSVSAANSCVAANTSCGEPYFAGRRPADSRPLVGSGRIWIDPVILGQPSLSQRHVVEHELGHALGLNHYEALYKGSYQVMAPGSGATLYQSGDRNGLSFLGQSPVDLPHVAFADYLSKTVGEWGFSAASGWLPETRGGHSVATGTSPSAVMVNHVPHIFFVDANNGNTITDWSWSENGGWQETRFGGHQVAANTSPVAAVVNGKPEVFFVDAANGNTISVWWWTGTEWQQAAFGGHAVAAGTKPTVTALENGDPRVYFVDANNNNTITEWGWSSSSGWKQKPLGGHQVAAGTSPSALVLNGKPNVFFSDAANKKTISVWWWTGTEWQQALFGGHAVATGSSPSAATLLGTAQVFFSDAANGNGLTVWWWTGTEWQQTPFSTHPVTAGSSPSAIMSNGAPHVYFSDATYEDLVTDFTWDSTSGWHQVLTDTPALVAGSSPSGF
jgi:hypothetical protein